MDGQRLLALTCCAFILSTLFHSAHAQNGPPNPPTGTKTYTIAVLSPSDGPLREVGQLHDESVKRAFQLSEGHLATEVENHVLRFRFLGSGDPTTEATTCVEKARSAVQNENVIAILGPVASGCAKQVLSENLEVPVLSTLSTAKGLSGQSEWFFRTIAHDQRRLETFVDTARGRGIDIDNSIAIYKPSVYGRGLLGHLTDLIVGLDSAHTYQWDEVIEEFTHDQIVLSEAFRQAMQDHHHALDNVFVLGSSERMVSVLQALDGMFASTVSDPNFILVGSTRFASDLPEDTWLIGEAQVHTSRNLITEITEGDPPDDLYISTLDASIALKEAIRHVLSPPNADALTPSEVRRHLRNMLEQNRFPSSERDRWVEFVNGEILDPPKIPIYQVMVERRAQIINPDNLDSWVEIRVIQQPTGHLEGPLVVELIPHGEDLVGEDVILQIEDLDKDPLTVREVELNRHGTRVSFVPSFFQASWFPNAFTISTNRTPALERVTVEGLSWPVSYLLAAFFAVIGVVFYTQHNKRRTEEGSAVGEGSAVERVKSWTQMGVKRCIAGLVIAFLIIHIGPLLEGEPLLSQIPIPQFGSSRWLNAAVSGLMGGWVGLDPIIGLIASVIATLTALFQSDS